MTNANEKDSSDCRNNICMTLMSVEQVITSLSLIFEGVAHMPATHGRVRAIPGAPRVHPLLLRRPAVEHQPVS